MAQQNAKIEETQLKPCRKNEVQFKEGTKQDNDTQMTMKQISNIYYQIIKQPPKQEIIHPISLQKNMSELAQELKKKLFTNIEKLLNEISQLENQIYDDQVTYYYHPSYQVNECLEGMDQLNFLIEQNTNNLQLMNGRQDIIQFYSGEETRQIQKFKKLQSTWLEVEEKFEFEYDYQDYEFQEDDDDDYDYASINAFDQSPNNKFLICCQYQTLSIWNIIDQCKVMKMKHQREISALKYCNDSDNFLIGDKDGYIAIFDSSSSSQLPKQIFKVHLSIICQIITKKIHLCYSSSMDNTIKLTDLINQKILLVIENNISCFMGIDYSLEQYFLLAPNNNQEVIVFNSNNGEQIASVNLQVDENKFINIQLSQNQRQALVNLFNQCKIFLIDININLRQIQVLKQLNLEGKCFRLSWCLNDQAFGYFLDGILLVRYFGNISFPLILENEIKFDLYTQQQPQINKFDPNLDQLMVQISNFIYFYKRTINIQNA